MKTFWWVLIAFLTGLNGGIFISTCCHNFKRQGSLKEDLKHGRKD